NPVLRDAAGHRYAHRTEGASLRHREPADPRGDALEPSALLGGKACHPPRQIGAVVIQRRARGHVPEPLGMLAEGDLPPLPDGLDDARRGRERLGVEARTPTGQLGNRAMGQQARSGHGASAGAGAFAVIGRRVTPAWRRASSARTSVSEPPPRTRATRAMYSRSDVSPFTHSAWRDRDQ